MESVLCEAATAGQVRFASAVTQHSSNTAGSVNSSIRLISEKYKQEYRSETKLQTTDSGNFMFVGVFVG